MLQFICSSIGAYLILNFARIGIFFILLPGRVLGLDNVGNAFYKKYHAIYKQGSKCTVGQKKKRKKNETLYIFLYKLSYRYETGTNHHVLLSTSI